MIWQFAGDNSTVRYPNQDQIVLAGRLSARSLGNQNCLKHIYEIKKDWMLEPLTPIYFTPYAGAVCDQARLGQRFPSFNRDWCFREF
jgi:hypothetical protein